MPFLPFGKKRYNWIVLSEFSIGRENKQAISSILVLYVFDYKRDLRNVICRMTPYLCLSVCQSFRLSVCSFPVCKLFTFFIFLSRTIEPIPTTLGGSKRPWVMGTHICSNERLRPFPRRDEYEISENTITKFNVNQTCHKARWLGFNFFQFSKERLLRNTVSTLQSK